MLKEESKMLTDKILGRNLSSVMNNLEICTVHVKVFINLTYMQVLNENSGSSDN